jgi:hypothetical protein
MPISEKKQVRLQILSQRIQRVDNYLKDLKRKESRYPWMRLVVFLVGGGLTTASFLARPAWLGWIGLVIFSSVFAVVVGQHRKVLANITQFEILQRLAVEQQARALLDWSLIPAPLPFAPEKNHPFEFDLNITGTRSLHQLIDSAASWGGSARLRSWLLNPTPDLGVIEERQVLLKELGERPGFRARLALAGARVAQKPGERWDGQKLLAWLKIPSEAASLRPFLLPLFLLAGINLVLFILFSLNRLTVFPWMLGLAAFWGLQSLKYRQTSELFDQAYSLARSLEGFRCVLQELETYPYAQHPVLAHNALADLARPFWQEKQKPSRYLRRLSRIVSAASLRNNGFLALLLNTLLPWDMFFTYLMEQYKLELGSLLPTWLDTWYELEAFCSLANFAFLNPDTIFPELWLEGSRQVPVLVAERVGHPLLADEVRVMNDFSITTLGEVAIVTGSNMSGKSTFLRTLGINLVLANAGATVCAASFCSLLFRIYTCINLSDSLSDGISYFYAEVRRLKGLLDELQREDAIPLFFLIDEIFRGTNNRERHQGGLAYTQALAKKHGTGLISTHDLDLVRLADDLQGVYNYHFREDVRDGRMVFDYRIRPGASPTTNALKIMALEGLPTQLLPEKEDGPTSTR